MVRSAFTRRHPRPLASFHTSASSARLSAFLWRGSSSGKWRPRSPRPSAPRIALASAWAATSASEWPRSPCECAIVTPPSTSRRPASSGWKSKPCPTLVRIVNCERSAPLTRHLRHSKLIGYARVLETSQILDRIDHYPLGRVHRVRELSTVAGRDSPDPIFRDAAVEDFGDYHRFRRRRLRGDARCSILLAQARLLEGRTTSERRRCVEQQNRRLIARLQHGQLRRSD